MEAEGTPAEELTVDFREWQGRGMKKRCMSVIGDQKLRMETRYMQAKTRAAT